MNVGAHRQTEAVRTGFVNAITDKHFARAQRIWNVNADLRSWFLRDLDQLGEISNVDSEAIKEKLQTKAYSTTP